MCLNVNIRNACNGSIEMFSFIEILSLDEHMTRNMCKVQMKYGYNLPKYINSSCSKSCCIIGCKSLMVKWVHGRCNWYAYYLNLEGINAKK